MRISKQKPTLSGAKQIQNFNSEVNYNSKLAKLNRKTLLSILILSMLIPLITSINIISKFSLLYNPSNFASKSAALSYTLFLMSNALIRLGFNIAMLFITLFVNFSVRDRDFFFRLIINIIILAIFSLSQYKLFLYQNISLASEGILIMSVYSGLGYLIMSAISLIVIQRYRNKKSNLKIDFLISQKTEIELTQLKEQISPHFFFNTLSSLSSIIRKNDIEQSLALVDNMTKVYRYILDNSKKDTIELAEEIIFSQAYSHILEKRFGRKLSITYNIENTDIFFIPPLAIQTCLENAVTHNIVADQDTLKITVKQESDFIIVTNNRILSKSNSGFGIGLSNINKRYEIIADQTIAIEDSDETFSVALPLINAKQEIGE